MRLAGGTLPVMEASNAASLGCFDPSRLEFDRLALKAAGISPRLFPDVTTGIRSLGMHRQNLQQKIDRLRSDQK